MSVALQQSFLGGNTSVTNTTPFTVTVTGNFSSNVPSGACVVIFASQNVTAATSGAREVANVNASMTGGPTANWRTVASNTLNKTSTLKSGFSIQYLQNCPAANAGDTLTVQFVFAGSGNTHTITCEFAAYVFTGVTTNANPSLVLDTSRTSATPSSGTPSTANLPTSLTDLILAGYTGDTGNISAGAGYTLGINMTVATFAQMQYILNQASGSIPTAFSGTETNYAAGAGALIAAAVTAHPISFGSIIGA